MSIEHRIRSHEQMSKNDPFQTDYVLEISFQNWRKIWRYEQEWLISAIYYPIFCNFTHFFLEIGKTEKMKCVRSTRMPRQAQVPWYPSQLTSVANGHDENSVLRQGGA